ncbi:hypothetical protein NDU88_004097 [Pleurodeles waltl]|uniref:Uncharacterized protein n=1 Tax=Pleurodeles waltl TaxID=8319 RepID=A0AAV7RG68_PLEWA|nr:hypothetical protein NDU88_004097 [Pleurodeles waltl]
MEDSETYCPVLTGADLTGTPGVPKKQRSGMEGPVLTGADLTGTPGVPKKQRSGMEGLVTGWPEPACTLFQHVLSLPVVNRNPTEAPPIREETPGHGGKTEEQEGWHWEFEERRSREERRTRNEMEERKKTLWREPQGRGPERPGSGSSPTGDGRTSIREAECSRCCVVFPGALKRPRYGEGGRVETEGK